MLASSAIESRGAITQHGAPATPSDKAAAFAQQMHAGGVLQVLPQVFSSLVVQMQTATGLGSPQLKSLQAPQQAAGLRSSAPASTQHPAAKSNNRTPGEDADKQGLVSTLACAATAALRLFVALCEAYGFCVFVAELVPEVTPAVLELYWLSARQCAAT